MLPTDLRHSFLPFVRPDYVEGMVIGDDLDSLLSALYLHRRYGWPVVATYCRYTRLWHSGEPSVFQRQLESGRLCAVDLDMYCPTLPSIGHHILRLGQNDGDLPGQSHSLNPNNLRGLSITQGFRRKYPLATIHLLLWLFEEKALSPDADMLVWLADSTYINAQQYTDNLTDWVTRFLQRPAFTDILPLLQTLDFEESLQKKILRHMATNPLCRPLPHSTYRSRHLGLNGFQCQWHQPLQQAADLRSLLQLLSQITGWAVPPFALIEPGGQSNFGCLEGQRHEIRVPELIATGLPFGEWLDQQGVFSYAFTHRERLNYTVM